MARPKLKPGEKGSYHVSRTVAKKREVQKELKTAKRRQEQVVKRIEKLNNTENKHKAGLGLAGKGGTTTEEFINTLPKDIRDSITDNTEVIFTPNKGPQVDFLGSTRERSAIWWCCRWRKVLCHAS